MICPPALVPPTASSMASSEISSSKVGKARSRGKLWTSFASQKARELNILGYLTSASTFHWSIVPLICDSCLMPQFFIALPVLGAAFRAQVLTCRPWALPRVLRPHHGHTPTL